MCSHVKMLSRKSSKPLIGSADASVKEFQRVNDYLRPVKWQDFMANPFS
jgi:hypothetical protein